MSTSKRSEASTAENETRRRADRTGGSAYDAERLAELVANDEMTVPDELSVRELAELTTAVCHRRTRSLIRFIARLIARDLVRPS